MSINVKGTTDTTGASSVLAGTSKTIVVVGVKGASVPTLTPNKLVSILSTKDASSKFGDNTKVVNMVKTLITNGVKDIKGILVDAVVAPATIGTVYESALDVLLGNPNIKFILLDTQETTVLAKLKTHLNVAEAEQMRRYGVTAIPSTITDIATMPDWVETNADHKRIFVAGPTALNDDGTDAEPLLLASALCAILATETNDPALPASGVATVGFGGVKQIMLTSEMEALTSAGITLFTMDGGEMVTYKVVTSAVTLNSDGVVIYHDATTILIDDYIMDKVRAKLKANYPRTKNVARVLDSMRGDVVNELSDANALEIIENFDEKLVSVIKDSSDIYGALVDYTFDVVTPLYTITLTQHMKL
jgi:hypothetical protein